MSKQIMEIKSSIVENNMKKYIEVDIGYLEFVSEVSKSLRLIRKLIEINDFLFEEK